MAKHAPEPTGLRLRLLAAQRLRGVLGGEHFSPLGPADLPDSRDRALANRLVTTALRRQGQLNGAIRELLDKGMPGKSGTFEAVLRLSLAQLIFLPDLGAHSALFLAVEAVKRDPKARHLSGLMNAVLRRAQANSARLSRAPEREVLPEAVRTAWTAQYGAEAMPAFIDGLLSGAPLDLTLKAPDPELVATLGAEPLGGTSLRLHQRDRTVDQLPGFAQGAWWVQDAAAALPARLLALPAGARVLDLCAAPGGKTAQLAAAGFHVTALDSDPARMARLSENLQRLDLRAEQVVADATAYQPAAPFDAVLLDAPCSATGTFRRHPEVLWHRTEADILNRVKLQRQLITAAFRCLKPGGTLIYCVCSLEAAEGEDQCAWIAEALPSLRLSPVSATELPDVPGAIRPNGTVRTHPGLNPNGVEGGMDGFFIARFVRA